MFPPALWHGLRRRVLGRMQARRHDSTWRTYRIHGVPIRVQDHPLSLGADLVAREIDRDDYHLRDLDLQPDDVVIDVGAHAGLFSLYIATRFPLARVIAIEPLPANQERISAAIDRAGITNIELLKVGLSSDGRQLELVHLPTNTGGASGVQQVTTHAHTRTRVKSITLDSLLRKRKIRRVRLLKIDCEGSEHEVLHATKMLGRIDSVVGEIHTNFHLEKQEHTEASLRNLLAQYIAPEHTHMTVCRMAE